MLGGLIPSDGATWTMGAMVAQTSGLPLKVKLRAENIQEDVQVLPGATVLGDMLAVTRLQTGCYVWLRRGV